MCTETTCAHSSSIRHEDQTTGDLYKTWGRGKYIPGLSISSFFKVLWLYVTDLHFMNDTKQITNSKDFLGKSVEVKIDRPLHSKHPKHGWPYQLNYGFVPGTLSPDDEELDAYVIGVDEPVETFTGICVAVIHRTNDNDDKLIVVTDDKKNITDDEIKEATNFQEQFFQSEMLRAA